MNQAYEKFEKARADLTANITLYNLIKGLPETLPNVLGSESYTAEKVALIEVANSLKLYAAAAQGIGHPGAQR